LQISFGTTGAGDQHRLAPLYCREKYLHGPLRTVHSDAWEFSAPGMNPMSRSSKVMAVITRANNTGEWR